MGSFDGQVVWITGGGTGIGRALAEHYAAGGAVAVVSGRRRERLDEAVAAIEAAGGRALAVPCDVTDAAACEAAVGTILEAHGRLDVTVANAGFGVVGRVWELSDEDWRRQLDVNVFGLLNTVRAAMPALEETGGRIGLIASLAARFVPPKNAAYSASKAAVVAIGEGLSLDLAKAGSGVSCTTILPGFIESEIGRVDNEGVFHPESRDKRPAQLMWTAEDAAAVMVRALTARKREAIVTGHAKVLGVLKRFAPNLSYVLAKKFA